MAAVRLIRIMMLAISVTAAVAPAGAQLVPPPGGGPLNPANDELLKLSAAGAGGKAGALGQPMVHRHRGISDGGDRRRTRPRQRLLEPALR